MGVRAAENVSNCTGELQQQADDCWAPWSNQHASWKARQNADVELKQRESMHAREAGKGGERKFGWSQFCDWTEGSVESPESLAMCLMQGALASVRVGPLTNWTKSKASIILQNREICLLLSPSLHSTLKLGSPVNLMNHFWNHFSHNEHTELYKYTVTAQCDRHFKC